MAAWRPSEPTSLVVALMVTDEYDGKSHSVVYWLQSCLLWRRHALPSCDGLDDDEECMAELSFQSAAGEQDDLAGPGVGAVRCGCCTPRGVLPAMTLNDVVRD